MGVNWSQGGQGAAGGAMTGAALGSVVPGVGTGIGALGGAILGGLGGLFGDDGASAYQDSLKKLAAKYGSMQAPQAGPAAQSGYSQFRGNQAGLAAQLEAMGRGEGPSAAALQMREAMDRAAGAQASAAAGAGGRGVNAGAAFRTAANNTAAIQAQGARDTATMRAAEQLAAIQQLGGVLNQGRIADEATNQFNAGATNDVSKLNAQLAMQKLGLSSEMELKALMAAMQSAGPGLGSQILAGGAMAFPSVLNRNPMGMSQPMPMTGGIPSQYVRNADGTVGPITSPSQV